MNFFSIVKEQNRFKNVSSSVFKHIFFFLFVIIFFWHSLFSISPTFQSLHLNFLSQQSWCY